MSTAAAAERGKRNIFPSRSCLRHSAYLHCLLDYRIRRKLPLNIKKGDLENIALYPIDLVCVA